MRGTSSASQDGGMTSSSWLGGVRAALIALVGALLVGGLTSFGQTVLPSSVSSLANSAGGWTAFTFLLIWLSRARPVLAAILGILAFEAMNGAYDAVTGWRGFPVSAFPSIWVLAGILAGPVVGLAASWVRYSRPLLRVIGVAILSAVLVGEGVYGILVLSASTSPVYWGIEIAAGVVFLVIALVRNRPRPSFVGTKSSELPG
jgi:hypothetical protein